ncbi:snake venom metalloproteinase-disintegrin-like mocarhagin [Glandiceps talaboti]
MLRRFTLSFLFTIYLLGVTATADEVVPEDLVFDYARSAGIKPADVHHYDVVYPEKTERFTRDTSFDDIEQEFHITVEIFGETHDIRLKRSGDFFNAPFVEYCGDGGIRWDRFPVDVDKSCFHSGYITGVENSLVAIKSCDGQDVTGWLIGNHTLFLQPIRSEHSNMIRERRDLNTGQQPHLVIVLNEEDEGDDPIDDVVLPPDDVLIPKERLRKLQSIVETTEIPRVTQPLYLELMVAVDKTAQEMLGNNTIPHILAMTNLLSTAYKHPSMEEIDLNIRLVRLILVEEDKCKPYLNISDDVYDRLWYFDGWAKQLNVDDDNSPLHFDYAFLFTEKDWVNSNVGGVAYMSSVCWKDYSVGLCPISTYISCYGHEMGHSLGMSHDATRCPNSTEKGFMSGGYYKVTECNKQQLRLAYSDPPACVLDKPNEVTTWPWPEYAVGERVISGELFSTDQQCRGYYYGKSVGECPWKTMQVQTLEDGDSCSMYCAMTDGVCQYWGKAIEGTPCGPGKVLV